MRCRIYAYTEHCFMYGTPCLNPKYGFFVDTFVGGVKGTSAPMAVCIETNFK
jgi:hypothetical protein